MKTELINFENLSDSREFLEAKTPKFIVVFIYLAIILVTVALVWMWFGEMDIVVKANGIVRPTQNISVIRNISRGKVEEINFYQGCKVEKGQVLYTINTSTIDLKKDNIIKKIKKIKKEIPFLINLKNSIRDNNIIKEDNLKYYNRYLVYKTKYEQLNLDYQKAINRYEREKSLSFDSTTRSTLEELKSAVNYTKLSMKSYRSKTLVNLENEIDSKKDRLIKLEEELKNIKARIKESEIKSPIGGTVKVVQEFNQGAYMPSGVEVLKIIPNKAEDLKMEITVRNKNISQLKQGQTVRYRFLALPHQEYGTLQGKIINISSDADIVQRGKQSLPYNVEATIQGKKLFNNKGKAKFVKLGMISEVRFVARRRKLFYIFLEKLDFIS